MAGVWKRDGTIAVTKGSKKVVGTGTTFADPKNAAAKGHLLVMVTGTAVDLYEVDYSESNSVFYLVEAYRGDTGTGKAYAIDTSRTDSIPEFARRLNATLGAYQQQSDAFQALLTSDAATIEVTAPDGTKHTMIPWKRVTSEGEGQAARAKVEADKAAASAALAGGIVEASALPLPDVWAPLSDSLRLITGYGRDVVVGSDVVASMVGFNRSTTATYVGKDGQLKTAAANEPRFEKEGLLIEGPSTNLLPISEGSSFSTANSGFQTITNGVSGVLPMAGQRISFSINNGETNANLVQTPLVLQGGQTYTYSCYLKIESGEASEPRNCISVYAANGVSLGLRAVVQEFGSGVFRVSLSFAVNGTGSQTVFIRLSRRGEQSAVWTAVAGGVQVENLPFATSYIPTKGSATSRSADVVSLPWALNVPVSNLSVAVNYDVFGVNPLQHQRIFEYGHNQTPRYLFQITSSGYFESFAATSGLSIGSPLLGYGAIAAASTTPNRHSVKITGRPVSSYVPTGPVMPTQSIAIGAGIGAQAPMYGHIRNLRIWHRALTDDQLKAVA